MADFFNNVLNKINKGVNSSIEASKVLIEKTKLNNSIKTIKENQNKILLSLGAEAFNRQISGEIDIEAFKSYVEEIGAMSIQINDLQEQIKALEESRETQQPDLKDVSEFKQNVIIPENNETAEETVETEETEEVKSDFVCSNCGFVNREGASFCMECGNKLQQ